ncbi:MAG: flagellar biosynthesis anti-sigma factor FlgM [Chitinispirillales bacterium]|jgi:anti-sigma28 factor (negative regulator of flagellin synthesis)|nr:flagellar biosynthesis anti-sigma factor FlgM [Chitinispirillales bacterium]
MLINKVTQAMQSELRRVDPSRRPERGGTVAASNTAVTDSSELSANGRKQREIRGDIQIISSMVKAQPDVRVDKMAEARAKIASGFYNTEDFAGKLAAKLANTLA